MADRYLIVSDLHLCDVEEHDDGWKAYKSARFLFDDELAALIGRFVAEGGGSAELCLILNGDVFDFDMVTAVPQDADWPVRPSEKRRGLDPTRGKSAWKLGYILDHHAVLVRALADFLARGHRVVYVLGNHDRELHFEEVREVFLDALRAAAAEAGRPFEPSRLTVEPWFFVVPGEVYVEHGQQYDYYTSFRHLLAPEVLVQHERMIALPMGNLSNRYLLTLMGHFNPFAADFILNVFAYATHWLRHYAFTKRSLFLPWLVGSIVVMGKLLRMRKLFQRAPDVGPLLDETAARYGLTRETVDALHALQRPPITGRFFRVVRELWIDRLLLATVLVGGTIALALAPIPLWIKLMVPLSSFPLLFFVYEWLARGETIFTIEERLPKVARRIAALVDVKVVTFGHTHVPRMVPLGRDLSYVDTGTWAPIMEPDDPGKLRSGFRNYLLVALDGGRPAIELGSLLGPEAERSPAPPMADEGTVLRFPGRAGP